MKDDLKDAEKFIETLKQTLKEFTAKKESGDPFYNYDETYENVLRNEFEQMRNKYQTLVKDLKEEVTNQKRDRLIDCAKL